MINLMLTRYGVNSKQVVALLEIDMLAATYRDRLAGHGTRLIGCEKNRNRRYL